MADIITAAPGNSPGRRRKKLSTKVDLTPMVDLGFLLLTFFVFNSKISEPKVADLKLPKDGPPSKQPETGALTVFPLDDEKIFYYHGILQEALASHAYGYTNYNLKDGLGKLIRDKHAAMDRQATTSRKDLMLMIKPSDNLNYGRVVDILDEMLINQVGKYAIVDISDEENKLLHDQLNR